MSKSLSGLFNGTSGIKANFLLILKHNSIIQSRTNQLDLREHPRKKSLTAKQRKEIQSKIASRTATKDEYKRFDSDKRFAERRKEGIARFWNDEQVRILSGQKATRPWNDEQKAAIARGDRPKYNGKTIQGHHTYSASKYPHLANRSEIIYPVTFDEHLYGWHGGNFKNSLPGKPIFHSTFYNFQEKKP